MKEGPVRKKINERKKKEFKKWLGNGTKKNQLGKMKRNTEEKREIRIEKGPTR